MESAGVMFDWDGVLMDSMGASFNVYNKIFAKIGTRQLTKDEFLRIQSPNWYEFYEKAAIPKGLWKEIDKDWVRLYAEETPSLHPDAIRCLTRLKGAGLKLALVSNGSKGRIDGELERFALSPFFDSTMYGVTKEHLKPSPFMLEKTLGILGIGPEEAFYVGDSSPDIQAAKSAGVPSIALARERVMAERLRAENPDHIFQDLDHVAAFLARTA